MTKPALRKAYSWIDTTAISIFLSVIICALIFLFSNYQSLVNHYLGLSNCFYKSSTWQQDFFTPEVKHKGNFYCILAIIFSILGTAYILFKKEHEKVKNHSAKIAFAQINYWEYLILCMLGISLWSYGERWMHPWYDEIFSAVHSSGANPLQTWSYYMLPNNHIFFNQINAIIFHYCSDKVVTGRLIALACYLGCLVIVFKFFRNEFGNKIFSFIATSTIATQLPTWGFATQARGYELLLLSGWCSVWCLYCYYKSKSQKWLYVWSIASFVGYATIPTFLYFHSCCVAFLFLLQISNRSIKDWSWIKFVVITLIFTYFYYLPTLCFSGLNAIKGNSYVVPEVPNWTEIFEPIFKNFVKNAHFAFSIYNEKYRAICYAISIMPLTLLFSKEKQNRDIALFYILLWLSLSIVTILMRSVAPVRAYGIQNSISLAIIIYSSVQVINIFFSKIKSKYWGISLTTCVCFCLLIHFIASFKSNVSHYLYGPDTNIIFAENNKDMQKIPLGSSIAFSDEAFYWFYHLSKQQYQIQKCPQGNEQYYIKRGGDKLPEAYKDYKLLFKGKEDYEIFIKPIN